MSWREFFASIVGSLAWPGLVLVICLAFRKQLESLFEAPLQRLKLGPSGVEAEWNRAERATAVAAVNSAAIEWDESDAVERRLGEIEPLIASDPALAIRQTFDVVDSQLRALIDKSGVSLAYAGDDIHVYLKTASFERIITRDLAEAIRGLIVLRDLTNNDPGGTRTTPEKAQDFLVIARSVLYSLGAASRRLPQEGRPKDASGV
jgi:hypothetical protein